MFQSKTLRRTLRRGGAGGLGLTLVLAITGCDGGHHHGPPRTVDAATIVLAAPAQLGATERPDVEFNHAAHVAALTTEGCAACHDSDDQGRVVPRLKGMGPAADLDAWMTAYHGSCLGCHEDRVAAGQATGPVGCGECHQLRPPATVQRAGLRMDYSLHARHVIAEQDRCDACHHVYDAQAQKLVPGKGQESSCRDCHGAQDEGSNPSLRNAVHTACVGCHQGQAAKGETTGPVACLGCHAAQAQQGYARLDPIPRLKRGQPDLAWIQVPGATTNLVPFDHRKHELAGDSCATCHHQTMQPCRDCHTLTGDAKGNGVTLEQAYHDPRAAQSCVGCHQQTLMADTQCAGCHVMLTGTPGATSCEVCHRGPRPELAAETPVQDFFLAPPEPVVPESSDDFPAQLQIDILAREYQAARLPHRKIAKTFAAALADSVLARRFHDTQTLPCAACHHRSPTDTRPPKCASCHSETAHPTKDQPHLLAAYHRQCVGCHQVMGLVTGCSECHEPATREVQP